MLDLSKPLPEAKAHLLTPEMEAILAHAPTTSMKVEAGAGAGKTTLLVSYAKKWADHRGLYLCFNAAIAKEAKSRFPSHITASTAHSYAFRSRNVGRHSSRLTGKIRKNDLRDARIEFNCDALSEDKMVKAVIKGIENFCNSAGTNLTPTMCGLGYVPRTAQERIMPLIGRVIDRFINYETSGLPFTHDIYLKNMEMHGQLGAEFDYIMVDEAQDLNPLLLSLIAKAGKPVVYVGDRKQSIYAFRGSVDALSEIDAKTYPLSQSWRFGAPVDAISNFILAETSVPTSWKLKGKPGHTTEVVEYAGSAAPYSLVLSRTNSRLFEGLVRIKVPFHVIGGFDAIAIQLLSALALSRGAPRRDIRDPLVMGYRDWGEMVADAKDGDDPEVRRIVKIIDDYGESLVQIIDYLKSIHSADIGAARLVLSTAHKAKGLESSSVVVLDDFLTIEDLKAKKQDKKLNWVDFDQELHLLYVSITRAIDQLQLATPLFNELKHLAKPT